MSARLRTLEVRLEHAPDDHELVGRLAELARAIYFEYDPAFLASRRSISPLHLPATSGAVRAPAATGLHGVFADALPDGWGLLLMDRHFRKHGQNPEQLSPLDRLAYLGARTMGALTFHPCSDDGTAPVRPSPLDVLAAEADKVLAGLATDLLPELLAAGGSPGGARPKVLVHVRGDELSYGTDTPLAGHVPWLIKFPSRSDTGDSAAVEYVYSRLARRAGLDVPETRLFVAASGQRFFGVRRFDRDGPRRVHVHTLAGALNTDFRVPDLDYALLLRVTTRLTRAQPEVVRAFRHLVFNVLAHNRDDHGKNFSFLMTRDGEWRLSPSYDLTFAEGPGGEHTMAIQGEAKRPTWSHLLQLARIGSISEATARQVLDEVRDALDRWPAEARAAGVPRPVITDLRARLAAASRSAALPTVVSPRKR
jgi:serine/threonine-protein kinase HipA